MNSQPLLVLDVHFLAHRAFHTSKDLAWQGKMTGVVFGFLKSITALKDQFQTDRVAFCFEHNHLFRKDLYPAYKRKRHTVERTPEEKESYTSFCIQISELRQRYLPKIGFKNIFRFNGMESDDIMATIAAEAPEEEDVILVTGDGDMFQCLKSNVSIYSPVKDKMLTLSWFIKEYGISPWRWAMVKAIAGCHGDEVSGIPGVGELTALRFLRGELKKTSNAYKSIRSEKGREIMRRNRPLVELPFEGCPIPRLVEDQVRKKDWLEVCGMLGMKSLASHPPIATRKLIPYGK